jgi:Gluconate 2-dehydrogenase subunit 3
MNPDRLHRRDVFRILGVTLTAEALLKSAPKVYAPRFLSQADYQTVDELCALLLPADEDSPGAAEAGVAWFIDTMLLYADSARQQNWRESLASIEQLAHTRFGSGFLKCTPDQRNSIMSVLAENEGDPQSPLEHFFAEFKPTVIQAFCLSEVGMRQYLHYRGNTELSDFPGYRPGEIQG